MKKVFVTPGAFSNQIKQKASKFFSPVTNFEQANFIIFSGGEDINPSLYGEDNKYSYFNNYRDNFEINVYQYAKNKNIPMFGICRGHQLLLALNGAKLVQDLFLELGVEHSYHHRIIIEQFKNIIPEWVNSMHHQGILVKDLPQDFDLVAYEPETNIVESSVSFKHKIITTQFHPEVMSSSCFDKIIKFILNNFLSK